MMAGAAATKPVGPKRRISVLTLWATPGWMFGALPAKSTWADATATRARTRSYKSNKNWKLLKKFIFRMRLKIGQKTYHEFHHFDKVFGFSTKPKRYSFNLEWIWIAKMNWYWVDFHRLFIYYNWVCLFTIYA